MSASVPPRDHIPIGQRWNTESVYPSLDAWEADLAGVAAEVEGLGRFQGHLREGAGVVADWFSALEAMLEKLGKVYVYASMFHHADTTDQGASALHDRARGLFARAMAAVAFAEPELIATGFETLRRWAGEEPRIGHLGHYLDDLERKQAHVRSAEVEELLGMVSDPFHTASATHGVIADADLAFAPARPSGPGAEPVPVAQGTIDALVTHADREVRRTAWESYADAHLAVRNGLASCLSAGVKQHVFTARARGYGSCLEAALHEDNVPPEVFHSLLGAFRAHLPTWHRYFRLRRRALGLETLMPYDLKAPLGPGGPAVPFDQAVEWIAEGMAPLGEEYVGALVRGVREQRWVDHRPNRGKRAGAFSTGWPGTFPFILMSFSDDVFSLSTLAHELGHSLHSYLTWKTQPRLYAHYSIFVAEVASNFNQAMVRAHLLARNPEPAFQLAVIEEAMSNFHRYFLVMPTLARFELEVHERAFRGEALTAETMSALMRELHAEAFGGEVGMDDERVGITWAEFPTHLYANFYVYQYATGISAANALAERVRAGEAGAVDRYLEFLRAGSSVYAIDALRRAGVDLTSPEPVEAAFGVLAGMVDRLEELVGGER